MLRLTATRAEELRIGLADAVQAREAACLRLLNHQAEIGVETASRGICGNSMFDVARWHIAALQAERALLASLNERIAEEEALRSQLRDTIGEQKRLESAIATEAHSEKRRATRRREAALEESALQRSQRA